MSYLLDTCVISDAARKADAGLEAWLRGQPPHHLHLSVLSLGEIQKGVELLSPGRKRETFRTWLDHDLLGHFAGRLLPVTSDVSFAWGRLAATAQATGRPLPVIDGLLLATAQTHGFTFVSRNIKDVDGRGVPVLGPYSGTSS